MKILVTGACGFIGKNLIRRLERIEGMIIYPFDVESFARLVQPAITERNCMLRYAKKRTSFVSIPESLVASMLPPIA